MFGYDWLPVLGFDVDFGVLNSVVLLGDFIYFGLDFALISWVDCVVVLVVADLFDC